MSKYQKRDVEAAGEEDGGLIHIELSMSGSRLEQMVVDGLRGMALEIGLEVAGALLNDEVERHCGPKSRRDKERTKNRHGRQMGSILMDGQRIAIERPRVRQVDGNEVELEMYRRLQSETGAKAVMERLVRGVSCRDYRAVVKAIRKSRGISASAVSRSFVEASAARVQELAERRFDGRRFVSIFIDGVVFARETVIASVGVTSTGEKQVLAIRHGATENARVCVDLLTDLRDRGVSTDQRILFVIDGSKALRNAIGEVWGANGLVQRCHVHKLRNVKGYVPEKHWPEVKARIQKAYADPSYPRAKKSLETTARWLELINPHAAASLREGLDETLTVTSLGLKGPLRRSLSTTNLVETLFSRTRMMTCRVKRWRPGTMRERWCATAVLHAEKGFHRIYGHADIAAQLLSKLDAKVLTNRQSA